MHHSIRAHPEAAGRPVDRSARESASSLLRLHPRSRRPPCAPPRPPRRAPTAPRPRSPPSGSPASSPDGLIVGSSGPDFGLTIDTGMALSTVAGQGGTVTAINNAARAAHRRLRRRRDQGVLRRPAGQGRGVRRARPRRTRRATAGSTWSRELEERTADATTGTAPNTTPNPLAGPDLRQVGVRRLRQRRRPVLRRACADPGQLRARPVPRATSCSSSSARRATSGSTSTRPTCPASRAPRASPAARPTPTPPSLAVINLVESGDKSPAVSGRPGQGGHLAGRPPARERCIRAAAPARPRSTPTPRRSVATPWAC